MKKVKFILTGLFFICSLLSASAQYGNSKVLDIGVMSLRIGGKYTKAQVQAAMGGVPTKYDSWPGEAGLGEEYDYNGNILRLQENGILVDFVIKSNQYPIFVQYSGGVRVGDSISKFAQLGLGTPERQPNGQYWLRKLDEVIYITVNTNNIITNLYYSFPN